MNGFAQKIILTTDNTDGTDLHGPKKLNQGLFEFVNPYHPVFIRGEVWFCAKPHDRQASFRPGSLGVNPR
jgi:hypothetical protein